MSKRSAKFKINFGLALLFLIVTRTSLAQVPQVPHVLIVVEENTDYADVCGPNNISMPFLCGLKSLGSFSANYYAPTHPSIGNYVDLGWGVITTNDDGCDPSSCGFPYTGDNIVRELNAAGKTWKGYAESLPSTCYFGGDSGQYAVRHSPIPYISDVQSNCMNGYVAFEDPNLGFAHDLAANTLPNYAFITPNLCDDAHDCTIPGSLIPDQWLQNNVIQSLLNGGHLDPTTGDTVFIVTFDESNADNTNGGGLVYWFMMGKNVKQNYQSTGPGPSPGFYSHESTLRVIAEMLGANFSGLGGAASAPDMTEFFGTSSSNPGASVSPTSLTFGSQTVGTTSAAQTVTLSNTGSAALTITSIVASGDFAASNTCGGSLAAGGNCSISVTFTPTASGTRTGSLSATNNVTGSPQTVSLTGTGATAGTPGASVSPTSLTFGNQTVGTSSAAQTVTVSNTGSAALTITSIVASGDFAASNTCGGSLAAGGNCSISVTLTPTASGTRTGSLSVTDNATGSPQTVSLTGTGSSTAADFSLSVSPTSGTITAGQSATFTLSVTPSGGFNQTVSLSCGGAPQAGTCAISPGAVTPNGSSASTATISLTTTARGMVVPGQWPRWISPPLGDQMELTKILWLIAALALLATIVVGRRRQVRLTLGLAMLMVVLGAGCTGVVKSTTTSGAGTPVGTYTLTLTGTSGTGSSALAHSVTVNLTVN